MRRLLKRRRGSCGGGVRKLASEDHQHPGLGHAPELRESFYHGVLLGLLSHEEHWYIASNAESGDGFCDIRIEDEERLAGILIELKYAEDGDLDAACDRALAQMEEKRYADALLDDGMERILKYGIACYKKRCRVKCAS